MSLLQKLCAAFTGPSTAVPYTELTVCRVWLNEHADVVVVDRGTLLTVQNLTQHDPDHNTIGEAQEELSMMSAEDQVNMAMAKACHRKETTAIVFADSPRFNSDPKRPDLSDADIVQRVNDALNVRGRGFVSAFPMP